MPKTLSPFANTVTNLGKNVSTISQNILALDIATKTGWAMVVDNVVTSGVLDLKGFYDEAERAESFEDWLGNKIKANDVNFVVIETVLGLKWGAAAYRLHGLQYLAHLVAYQLRANRKTVPPSTLKKFTTGNGRAKKKDMIAAVEAWGFNPKDDNEADALALLTYAQEKLT